MAHVPSALRLLCLGVLILMAACASGERAGFSDASRAEAVAAADSTPPLSFGRRVGAGLIREAFDADAARTLKAMGKHQPAVEVTSVEGIQYRDGDADALLDIHFPTSAVESNERLPVLVWIHGGAWLSGSRRDAAPLFRLIAAEGYAVVAPDYSQLAAMGSSPAYAAEVGLPAVFTPDVLRGVALQCGVLDLRALVDRKSGSSRLLGWGSNTTVLAYARTRDPESPLLAQMSPILHVTADFPPTWITAGNADPLTPGHSLPFAERLQALGVPVTTLFWPEDHEPGLQHLYPFNLDSEEGQRALRSMLAFLASRRGGP